MEHGFPLRRFGSSERAASPGVRMADTDEESEPKRPRRSRSASQLSVISPLRDDRIQIPHHGGAPLITSPHTPRLRERSPSPVPGDDVITGIEAALDRLRRDDDAYRALAHLPETQAKHDDRTEMIARAENIMRSSTAAMRASETPMRASTVQTGTNLDNRALLAYARAESLRDKRLQESSRPIDLSGFTEQLQRPIFDHFEPASSPTRASTVPAVRVSEVDDEQRAHLEAEIASMLDKLAASRRGESTEALDFGLNPSQYEEHLIGQINEHRRTLHHLVFNVARTRRPSPPVSDAERVIDAVDHELRYTANRRRSLEAHARRMGPLAHAARIEGLHEISKVYQMLDRRLESIDTSSYEDFAAVPRIVELRARVRSEHEQTNRARTNMALGALIEHDAGTMPRASRPVAAAAPPQSPRVISADRHEYFRTLILAMLRDRKLIDQGRDAPRASPAALAVGAAEARLFDTFHDLCVFEEELKKNNLQTGLTLSQLEESKESLTMQRHALRQRPSSSSLERGTSGGSWHAEDAFLKLCLERVKRELALARDPAHSDDAPA